MDKVCEDLEITEGDYFGLLYTCRGDDRSWLDLERRLSKTFRSKSFKSNQIKIYLFKKASKSTFVLVKASDLHLSSLRSYHRLGMQFFSEQPAINSTGALIKYC